ncbi:MAG: type II secretion system F family protein [Vulcanimicrobiaceae bacterium]
MVLLIPLAVAVSAFLLALSAIPSKSALDKTLEELEAGGLTPKDSKSVRAFGKILSKESQGKLSRRLAEAGWYTVTPARMGMRITGGGVGGLVLAFVFVHFLHLPAAIGLVMTLFGGGVGAYAPLSMLQRAVEARKIAVQKALPDFLDMVATTVQAGLSVNAALAYAIDAAPGALGEEITSALSEIRLGRSRSDALRAAAERLQQQQFSTTISAITQAERLGTDIAKVLNELAEDVRNQRVMLVEEMAAKLPVKMVMPMALFMLPSLFVVIFGALAANYLAPK